MTSIGFSLQRQYSCPQDLVVLWLREAGFSAISPVWYDDLRLEELATSAIKHNMTIQSIHAPHGGAADLWDTKSERAEKASRAVISCIEDCARFEIPIMVMHGWQGLSYTFPETPLDFSSFDTIVEYAEKKNVAIAFENLEGEEYLEALLTRYCHLPYIGYCWDSGHDHCYPHKLDFLEAFGSRLMMTHINDNLGLRDPGGVPTGDDDLHFLPYDGNIPWERELHRLKNAPKQQILNFELKKRSTSVVPADLIYEALSLEKYIQLAGERARKIAGIYEEIQNAQEA